MAVKKASLLLLALPLVGGIFYLRALASWRPQLVLEVPPTRSREAVKALAFSDDGTRLAVGMAGTGEPDALPRFHSVTSLNAEKGFATQWQWGPSSSYPEGYKDGRVLRFLQHDSAILLDGNVGLWDAQSGKTQWDQPTRSHAYTTVSPDGKWVASNYDLLLPMDEKSINERNRKQGNVKNDKQVYIYKIQIKKLGRPSLTLLKKLTVPRAPFYLNDFFFFLNGANFVLPVGEVNRVHLDIYNTTSWKLTKSLNDGKWTTSNQKTDPRPDGSGYFLAQASRNGRFLLSGWLTLKGVVGINLWRISDGKRLFATRPNILAATLAPNYEVQNDGSLIAWGGDGSVYRSQGANFTFPPKPLFTLPNQYISAATLSPDGSTLAVGTAKGAYTMRLK